MDIEKIRVRIMSEAYDLADRGDHEGYNAIKVMCGEVLELIAVGAQRQALETEPFEYRNAVEGWVKIDEVREHFDAVGCGTIYKSAGEGRFPLYTTPPKREWVGLTDEDMEALFLNEDGVRFARYIEAKLREKNT